MAASDLNLRPLDPTTVGLWREALVLFRGVTVSESEMLQFASDPAAVGHLVVDASSEVVGWSWGHVQLHVEGFLQGQLYDLEVTGAHRRVGLGSSLLNTMRSSFVALGVRRMWLFTDEDNKAAKSLYELSGGVASPHDDATYWWKL